MYKESKHYKLIEEFKINDYISTNGSVYKVTKKNDYTVEILQLSNNQTFILGNKLYAKKVFKNSFKK